MAYTDEEIYEADESQLRQMLITANAENKKLRKVVADYECENEEYDEEERTEALVNRIVEERLAEEDRRNDERAKDDPDYAYELRCIRYLESRYDDC